MLALLLAWSWVEVVGAAEFVVEVAGVLGMLLALSELEERWRRDGVGCVTPVS